LNSSMS